MLLIMSLIGIGTLVIEGGTDLVDWVMRKRRSRRYRCTITTQHREYR